MGLTLATSWLKTWVDFPQDNDALSETLTSLGLEVESLMPWATAVVNDVVIAQITEVAKHPDADRLNICQVQVSEKESYTVV